MSKPIPTTTNSYHHSVSSSTIPLSSSPSARGRSLSNTNASPTLLSQSPLSTSPIHQMIMMKKTTSNEALTAEEVELMNQKKERFQTCKEVLDRLHWDTALSDVMQNLSMIYKDRFEGDILIAWDEFENSELKEDLPEHRIQTFIYRDQHVFWDKNKRIDLISSKEIFPLIDSYINPTPQTNTTHTIELKKKKKKSKLPMVSLDKSKLVKSKSNDDMDRDGEEEDEVDEYIAEYDEIYGRYMK